MKVFGETIVFENSESEDLACDIGNAAIVLDGLRGVLENLGHEDGMTYYTEAIKRLNNLSEKLFQVAGYFTPDTEFTTRLNEIRKTLMQEVENYIQDSATLGSVDELPKTREQILEDFKL